MSRLRKLPFAVMICGLAISACSNDTAESEFMVRVKQVRCPDGFVPGTSPKCKGQPVEAGTFDFRLRPKERRALVRVVSQDPSNPSVNLFELNDCKVWDAKNWECTNSTSAFTDSYELHNGEFSHVFVGAIASTTYYTGMAQVKGVSIINDFFSR